MSEISGQSILVISSNTTPGLSAPINHHYYCTKNGYEYLFDATPYDLGTPFDQKLNSILANARRSSADWIFWIDDDAYFMRLDQRLESFLNVPPEVLMIICKSPLNPHGNWSAINSGLFFIRNTPAALDIIKATRDVSHEAVREWGSAELHGVAYRQGGDQLRLLYVLTHRGLLDTAVRICDAEAFNARPYQFATSPEDHFVCHLANNQDKLAELVTTRRKFAMNEFLLPNASDLSGYRWSVFFNYASGVPAKVAKKAVPRLSLHWIARFLRSGRTA